MEKEVSINVGGHDHQPKEIIIKINIEEVFQGNQCHPEPEEGTVIYYIIKVDKQQFEVKQPKMTGRQILHLVGYTPEKYALFEIGEGQKQIAPDEEADFRKCGIERFKTVAKEANEGIGATVGVAPLSVPMRREIQLLPDDLSFLNHLKLKWETVREQNAGWILIYGFPVPAGYNVSETTLALMIPPSYPTTEFDMAYFLPALGRSDGKTIGALTNHHLDGKSYQRWSRHRSPGVWRSGIDNLETHILSVTNWLITELLK